MIVAHACVEIGPRVAIGDWAALDDAAPTYDDVERPVRAQPLRSAPIRVGAGAVLGPHAALRPGATVAPAGAAKRWPRTRAPAAAPRAATAARAAAAERRLRDERRRRGGGRG